MKYKRPKTELMYPDLVTRQCAVFARLPQLRDDYEWAMREAGCDPCIWDRVYGQFMRVGALPKYRAQVWRLLRERGWSFPLIAYATRTACHTTVITALHREAVTA